MFGLIVEYLDGSEHNAYDYIMQNTQLFNNFFWTHPLKKTTEDYLFSLYWTRHRQLGDDGKMKKWWTHPECPQKIYSVAAAVNFVNKNEMLFH